MAGSRHLGTSLRAAASPAGGRTVLVVLAEALVAGLALGSGSMLLQGWVPRSAAVVANCGALWAVVAFAVGMLMRSARAASVGSAVALVVASFSYYLVGSSFLGMDFDPLLPTVWAVAGVAAGLTLGFAGFRARCSPGQRPWAFALLAGGLIGEGVHLTMVRNDSLHSVGVAELMFAVFLAASCVRTRKEIKPVGRSLWRRHSRPWS